MIAREQLPFLTFLNHHWSRLPDFSGLFFTLILLAAEPSAKSGTAAYAPSNPSNDRPGSGNNEPLTNSISTVPAGADWMSDHLDKLGNRALKTLVLPASHDSAMYQMQPDLLQFSVNWWFHVYKPKVYSFDDETVRTVSHGIAGQISHGMAGQDKIEGAIADGINGTIGPYAINLALTQDISIGRQLTNGIRYFDLRPKFQDGAWYLYHGQAGLDKPLLTPPKNIVELHLTQVSVTGPALEDVLNQVQAFVQSHRELVIMNFSHYQEKNTHSHRFQKFDDDAYLQLVTMITNHLGPWLYYSLPPGKRLAGVTLGDYLANPSHGRVLVVCDREHYDTDYPIKHPAAGIWPYEDFDWTNHPSPLALRVYDNYSNTRDFAVMKADQLAKFRDFGSKTSGTDTCDLFELAWGPANDGTASLRDLAEEVNPRFADDLEEVKQPNSHGRILNLIGGDFVEDAHVAEVALYMNTNTDAERPTLPAKGAAMADRSPAFGGNGGQSFDDSHDIQAWGRINKIVVRHSSYVDAIGIAYANGNYVNHGTTGGTQTNIRLGQDEFIVGVEGRYAACSTKSRSARTSRCTAPTAEEEVPLSK